MFLCFTITKLCGCLPKDTLYGILMGCGFELNSKMNDWRRKTGMVWVGKMTDERHTMYKHNCLRYWSRLIVPHL